MSAHSHQHLLRVLLRSLWRSYSGLTELPLTVRLIPVNVWVGAMTIVLRPCIVYTWFIDTMPGSRRVLTSLATGGCHLE